MCVVENQFVILTRSASCEGAASHGPDAIERHSHSTLVFFVPGENPCDGEWEASSTTLR